MAPEVTERERPSASEDAKPNPATPAKDTPVSKRKNSEAGTAITTPTIENGDGKKKRRKVNHACVYCRRSHMTCDLERPCARCIKRDIGHLCHDEPRDPPKRNKSEAGVPDIAPAPSEVAAMNGDSDTEYGRQSNGLINGVAHQPHPPQLAQPTPLSPTQIHRPSPSTNDASINLLQSLDWNNSGVHNQFQDMHHLHPNYLFNTSEVTNEYNLLNDFLSSSLLDDGGMYSADDAQTLFSDPLLASSSMSALASNLHTSQQNQPTVQSSLAAQLGQQISRPTSTLPVDSRARDKFYMTAADPAGLESAESRLHKLLKAKYDAGMLKPFNYVKGYARLNSYMSKHLSRESQLRILKQLDRFRPKFREAMHLLTDMQLVLVEMWFERSLMEYDRVFASMAIPACCWRRTGEIFRGNTEMAELLHVSLDKMRDGKLAIHEVIAEDSLVSYWEKFGAIAFDQSQKAILTSCALMRPKEKPATSSSGSGGSGGGNAPAEGTGLKETEPNRETVRCCFSFTIRRDSHNIPSILVGNFLPIQDRGKVT